MHDTIPEVINKYQTPMFIYDRKIIEKQYDVLKASLISNASLLFSMKANPLLGICQVLHQKGCEIEVSSKGELYAAMEAGYRNFEIIFTSPGKTYDEIQFAVRNRIKLINIESYEEAVLINKAAEKENTVMNIGIRVNPETILSSAKIRMSGTASQFGIEEETLDDSFFRKIRELKNIKLVGIHTYIGTQILEASDILYNTRYIIEMALRLTKNNDFKLEYLNLGGGFGIPYFESEHELDMQALKNGMNKIEAEYSEELIDTHIFFESGRYLLADSGIFVTKILYKKQSKGTEFIVCDGGSNLHSASAFLGRFIRNNYPLYTIPDSIEKTLVTVVGPLCTPTDIIGQKVKLNKYIQPGDYVIIRKSGAYGLTHSPLKFLSHESPIEILISGDQFIILRERETVDQLLVGQNKLTSSKDENE